MLDGLVNDFRSALDRHWPNSVLGYSLKTNSLPWLLNYLRQSGLWAEVVSDTEYELALALGWGPHEIIYNGPIKGRERLDKALAEGSVINLDAQREVEWVCAYAQAHPDAAVSVGLRIYWDVEAQCPGELVTSPAPSRFGFSVEDGALAEAIWRLQAAGVRISGLQAHLRSQFHSAYLYEKSARALAQVVTQHDLTLDYVDLGGGFFGGTHPNKPTFDDYVRTIVDGFAGVIDPRTTRLIVEPGAALVEVPFEFHTSVLDTKCRGDQLFVITDGSRTNIDPLYARRNIQHTLQTDSSEPVAEQVIAGFSCMEQDIIMRVSDAPRLSPGDRVIYRRVGSYTLAFQSTFIEYHPEVYVRHEGALDLVRRRWGVREHLQGSLLPDLAHGE